ncbi:hypothetical protein RchiOBHm_Chr3g0460161 [Rosa chinensis]|uniref:Uncharacterized protein n=1 Tax=Rosa chinensis TaxID=74649 RepID=A0A2P6R8D8_ROSCH|nr:hypothetical protein RchiOBHm_Chr3g0460161 [Rosa chinensis]
MIPVRLKRKEMEVRFGTKPKEVALLHRRRQRRVVGGDEVSEPDLEVQRGGLAPCALTL